MCATWPMASGCTPKASKRWASGRMDASAGTSPTRRTLRGLPLAWWRKRLHHRPVRAPCRMGRVACTVMNPRGACIVARRVVFQRSGTPWAVPTCFPSTLRASRGMSCRPKKRIVTHSWGSVAAWTRRIWLGFPPSAKDASEKLRGLIPSRVSQKEKTHMDTAGPITRERRGPIFLIGLNRPAKRNAFDLAMLNELALAYGEMQRGDEVRSGVLFPHADHFTPALDLPQAGPP